jgi:hypothetical protein
MDSRLPLNFAPQQPSVPELHIRGPDDSKTTWVQLSYFCVDGGMGFFFEVTPGTSLPGGALLAVYYGRSNVSLQLKYKEAQKLSVNESLHSGWAEWPCNLRGGPRERLL